MAGLADFPRLPGRGPEQAAPNHVKKKQLVTLGSGPEREGSPKGDDVENRRALQEQLTALEEKRKRLEKASSPGLHDLPRSAEPSPGSGGELKIRFNKKRVMEAIAAENDKKKQKLAEQEVTLPHRGLPSHSRSPAVPDLMNDASQRQKKTRFLDVSQTSTPPLVAPQPQVLVTPSPSTFLSTPTLSAFRTPFGHAPSPAGSQPLNVSPFNIPTPEPAGPEGPLHGQAAPLKEGPPAADGQSDGDGKPKRTRNAAIKVGEVEPPDWLPEGWRVEIKVRTGGKTSGTSDKYYFHPESNKRFRSRVEVQKFLETGDVGRARPRESKKSSSPAPVLQPNGNAFAEKLAEGRKEQEQRSTPPPQLVPPKADLTSSTPPLSRIPPASKPSKTKQDKAPTPSPLGMPPFLNPMQFPGPLGPGPLASKTGLHPQPLMPGTPFPYFPGYPSPGFGFPGMGGPGNGGPGVGAPEMRGRGFVRSELGALGVYPGAAGVFPGPGAIGGGFPGAGSQGFPGADSQGFPGAGPQGFPGAGPQGFTGPGSMPLPPYGFPPAYLAPSVHQKALTNAALRAHGWPAGVSTAPKGKAKVEKKKLVPASRKDLEVIGRTICQKSIVRLAKDHLKRASALPLKDILAVLPKDLFVEKVHGKSLT